MRRLFKSVALTAIVLAATAATAPLSFATHNPALEKQESGHEGHHGEHAVAPNADEAEAVREYREVAAKMHQEMDISYSGDIDVDFVRGMVPHHQGAIDQAKVLLKHSKDMRLRRLALGIIAAQTREIRFMKRWLREHDEGVKEGASPTWLSGPLPEDDQKASD